MKRFTPTEDQYIRDHYLDQKLEQLGAALNRSFGSVAGRMRVLNLIVPAELKMKRMMDGLKRGWELPSETRFKPGFTPWNKGMKGLNMGGQQTQFKKGHLPHNTRHDGATRISKDGYIEERVALHVWKLKHRLVWEQHNGPIPPGYNVKFKDGNRQNVDISNLYMVSRKENMLQNTIHNYPPEVKQAIHNVTRLTKTIKKQEHEANKH